MHASTPFPYYIGPWLNAFTLLASWSSMTRPVDASRIRMPSVRNQAWTYVKDPMGTFVANKAVMLKDIDMPVCENGSMVVRALATGVNVAFRARMQSGKPANEVQEAFSWWKPGDTFTAEMVGEVVESKAKGYKIGDWIQGSYKLQKYFVAKGDGSDNPFKIPPTKLDKSIPVEKQFAMRTGISALLAIDYAYVSSAADYKIDAPKVDVPRFLRSALSKIIPCGGCCRPSSHYSYKDKVCVVTAASSAVGVIAGQLLKIKGCKKVIGITSTKDKAAQLLEEGFFDVMIARKEEDVSERLKAEAPEGVDFNFEMAGGKTFQAVLDVMNKFGKVVVVGDMQNSDKKASDHEGVKIADACVGKSVEISGFFITDYFAVFPFALMRMKQLEKSGKIRSLETVFTGFESWGKALESVMSSSKIGQTVLKVV